VGAAIGTVLRMFAGRTGEPLAEVSESAASTRTVITVRDIRSVRRIESIPSVGPSRTCFEYPRRCAFV
jgi:hypothetical protein